MRFNVTLHFYYFVNILYAEEYPPLVLTAHVLPSMRPQNGEGWSVVALNQMNNYIYLLLPLRKDQFNELIPLLLLVHPLMLMPSYQWHTSSLKHR